MTSPEDRIGIGFLGGPGLRELARAAQVAESGGFESAWMAETRITRDAVTAITAILLATHRMRVGSSAINVLTRAPALVAMTWATLAEAAPGRVVLGIGVGSPSTLAQQGLQLDHAVGRLRDFIEAVRLAWTAPPPISYEGRYTRLAGLETEVQPPQPPPVYVCAGGPRTLALAGRIADGVVSDVFLPPAAVATVRSRVDAGGPGSFTGEIAGAVVTSIADSLGEAADRLRPKFAEYLVRFPELADEMGLDPEYLQGLRARFQENGLGAVLPEIPDEVIARCAACGSVSDCREKLDEYRAAGVHLPIVFPEPLSLLPAVTKLGPA